MLTRREALLAVVCAAIATPAAMELSEQAQRQQVKDRFDAIWSHLTPTQRERTIAYLEWLADNPHTSRAEKERRMDMVFA
ncbi:hypothetical protein [Niveispirillum sp. KHB5.9]|uniref:hypothetical protein n=1 Tax=Niveispirillum sp. KHB5.9 TaxID=3400269 RepID=UPI003A8BD636